MAACKQREIWGEYESWGRGETPREPSLNAPFYVDGRDPPLRRADDLLARGRDGVQPPCGWPGQRACLGFPTSQEPSCGGSSKHSLEFHPSAPQHQQPRRAIAATILVTTQAAQRP